MGIKVHKYTRIIAHSALPYLAKTLSFNYNIEVTNEILGYRHPPAGGGKAHAIGLRQ